MMRGRGEAQAHATMRDVAALAGVGIKTVSRVINGEAGVSDGTALRVRRAAEQLGYRHNLTASNLRRGRRTASVGVLLQDVGNSFSAGLLRAVEDHARMRDVVVLSASLDEEEERERHLVRDFVSRRVDGLLVMPASHDQAYLESDLRAGVAVVLVDRPPHGLDVDCVMVDNRGGTRQAIEHLLERGHRRIGYLGDLSTICTAGERLASYHETLARHGVEVDPALVHGDVRSAEQARGLVHWLLTAHDPPTALFTARNVLTIGAVQALRDRGLNRRVALAGFDDFPMSDQLDPAVTVVRQDVERIGRTAAELLFARMDGSDVPVRHLVLPAQLVPRESSTILPGAT
jgi:LacI family transcriptional regulator